MGGRPNLANMWSVNFAFDAEEFEMLLRSDPGKHKDLWRVGDSCRENDLFRRSDRELLAAFIDAHCAHHSVTSEDQFLDFWLRDDGDVGLAVDEDDTRRALALVDGAHALDKAILLAFVDIIGERSPLLTHVSVRLVRNVSSWGTMSLIATLRGVRGPFSPTLASFGL